MARSNCCDYGGCPECQLAELIESNVDAAYEARDATKPGQPEPMSAVAEYWAAEWARAGASS